MIKGSLRLAALGLAFAVTLALPAVASSHDGEHDRRSIQGAAHGNLLSRAHTPPALAAPVIGSCGAADGSATATWGAVTDATKYSVEFLVGYDLVGSDGCADAFLEFEYDATDPTVTVPLTDFDHNFCTDETPCVASPASIVVRVKALNPPSGGPKGSGAPQNNPFSQLCVIQADSCAPVAPTK